MLGLTARVRRPARPTARSPGRPWQRRAERLLEALRRTDENLSRGEQAPGASAQHSAPSAERVGLLSEIGPPTLPRGPLRCRGALRVRRPQRGGSLGVSRCFRVEFTTSPTGRTGWPLAVATEKVHLFGGALRNTATGLLASFGLDPVEDAPDARPHGVGDRASGGRDRTRAIPVAMTRPFTLAVFGLTAGRPAVTIPRASAGARPCSSAVEPTDVIVTRSRSARSERQLEQVSRLALASGRDRRRGPSQPENGQREWRAHGHRIALAGSRSAARSIANAVWAAGRARPRRDRGRRTREVRSGRVLNAPPEQVHLSVRRRGGQP